MTPTRQSRGRGGAPAPIPTRLRAIRRQAGKTVEEVALDLGASHSQISRMESGAQAITLGWLRIFSEYYRLPISDFLSPQDVSPYHAGVRPVPILPDAVLLSILPERLREIMELWGGPTLLAPTEADGVFAFIVSSDCISLVVPRGATILVDSGQIRPEDGGRYLIRHGGRLLVREFRNEGSPRFITRRADLHHELPWSADGDDVAIIGRAIKHIADL